MAIKSVHKAAVILSAIDRMTKPINKATANAESRLHKVARASANTARRSAAFASQNAVVAAGIASALAVPVKKAMDFEQTIARLGAISKAEGKQLAALSARAREMGATTQFSAMQSAEAMTFLAMSGLSVKQTMTAIPSVLNLAAAGNLSLARSADIASDVMSAFSLQAKDLVQINDILASTSTSSNTTVESLAGTMKFAASTAAGLNINLKQVAGMAGILGNNFIRGEMAGTGLRTMMLSVSAPTSRAEKALKKISVTTADAEGNLKDFPALLSEIGKQTSKLSSTARSQVIKDIFGREASTAAGILLNSAAKGELNAYINSLGEANAAQKMAAKQMQTSRGASLLLKSATEELAINVGNVLLPPVTELMMKAAKLAGRLSKWASEHPKLTKVIIFGVSAVAALAATLAGLGFVISGVATTISVLATVGGTLIKVIRAVGVAWRVLGVVFAANPIGAIITGVVAVIAVTVLLIKHWDKVKVFFTSLWSRLSLPVKALIAVLMGPVAFSIAAVAMIIKHWSKIKTFFFNLKDKMFEAGKGLIDALVSGIKNRVSKLTSTVASMAQKVRDFLPFSPAKVGPLKDLNRIKLVETIASTVKPRPLESAMDSALSGGLQPVSSGGGGGTFSINFQPSINITGGSSPQNKLDIIEALRSYEGELVNLIQEAMRKRDRSKF